MPAIQAMTAIMCNALIHNSMLLAISDKDAAGDAF
jgi:hypothetical protein